MRSFYRAAVISSCFIAQVCALEVDSDFADASVPKYTLDSSSSEQSITLDFSATLTDKNVSFGHWYFRVRDIDINRPLMVQIKGASKEGKSARVYYTGSLSENWQALDLKKDVELFSGQIALKSTSLFLANQPPLGLATFSSWIEGQREKHAFVDKVTNITTASGEWVPVLRISEGDKVDARRLAILVDADSALNSNAARWCLMGVAKWILGEELDATWLRQNCEIVILPGAPSGVADVLKSIHADQRKHVYLRFHDAPEKAATDDGTLSDQLSQIENGAILISIPLLPPDDESDFTSFYMELGETTIEHLTRHLQKTL